MNEHLQAVLDAYRPLWHKVLADGEIIIIVPLLYHVALYIDPEPLGGCADRYCLLNLELAISAAEEYELSGEMRYWQKHHSRNLSVDGEYLYPSGVPMQPENAVGKVDWNLDDLRRQYSENHHGNR